MVLGNITWTLWRGDDFKGILLVLKSGFIFISGDEVMYIREPSLAPILRFTLSPAAADVTFFPSLVISWTMAPVIFPVPDAQT